MAQNLSSLVRIGLPVLNGEAHLEEALLSLLNQTHRHFEICIVDNASCDGTPDIAARFARLDSRVRFLPQKDRAGSAENWSRTFKLAAPGSSFFMWASHDDLWAPDYIESLLPILHADPGAVLAFSQVDNIDKQGTVVGHLYRDHAPAGSTPLGRIRSVLRSGKYSAIYGILRTAAVGWTPCLENASFGSDLWFLMRLAVEGRFRMLERPLFFKRRGGVSEVETDPSVPHDPHKVWNVDRAEWERLASLRLGFPRRRFVFYNLKVLAKLYFPDHKSLEWFLFPWFLTLLLRSNARALGIRTRLAGIQHPW